MSETFFYSPRGIGKNWLPCCICGRGGSFFVQADMAAFVRNKEEGEAVVSLFAAQGVRAELDYRPQEPDWVQVKLGACSQHEPFLAAICRGLPETPRISAEVITQALRKVGEETRP